MVNLSNLYFNTAFSRFTENKMLQNIAIVITIVLINIVIHFTAESIKLSKKKLQVKS